ncbi:MAG: hypothetical protein ACHBN1_37375 [Heteroscytonema crispum UTEX LB 1556]
MKKVILIFVTVVLIGAIFGCSSGNKSASDVSTPNTQTTSVNQGTPASNVAASTEKIKFKTAGGSDLFSLKQVADGAKLVDANEKELARIKTDKPGKIKLKNADDKVLGYVVAEKGYWKVENPEQNKELYILRRQDDGNYKLEDGAKKEIYIINASKNGLEIGTPDKKLVYGVKVKEGKTSLNASGKTVFSTKSNLSPIAFACFGFDVLTREQQAALAYAVNLTGGQ